MSATRKRGYSRAFTPRTETYGRYLLDRIPATLWREAKAQAKREGVSVRAFLLAALQQWVSGSPLVNPPDSGQKTA